MKEKLLSRLIDFFRIERHSPHYNDREEKELAFNFFYADRFLRIFTFFWLFYQVYNYFQLQDRPKELFIRMNYFSKSFISEFPSSAYFFSIIIVALISNSFSIKNSSSILNKALLLFCIMWFTCLKWSYGFASHVGHFFILTHFFGLFIPAKSTDSQNQGSQICTIRLFYFGLMVTYTISGIWKLGGLIQKLVFSPHVIHWLHPQAALVNAVSGYRFWDNQLGSLLHAYDYPIIWQILFLLTLYLQIISFVASVRLPLFYWIGLGTIIFHIHNIVFMRTEFYVTPIIITILFFPYHLILKKKSTAIKYLNFEIQKSGEGKEFQYKRIYENGISDEFIGFYAFREQCRDSRKWYYGFLFFPGISLFANFYLLLKSKLFFNRNSYSQ
ncbi:hypothetical protein [Sporocytophaga myxococcoides]|uniref:hypothetical protein n=1 Tax=Sporocytophaga myxococcoides TaxID=153721 RepID=UPI0004902E10|nr:hypothetical protein [Sporocytophaga myxococcoides]